MEGTYQNPPPPPKKKRKNKYFWVGQALVKRQEEGNGQGGINTR